MNAGVGKSQKRTLDPQELDFQMVLGFRAVLNMVLSSTHVWLLGNKVRSSARAAHVLNC